MREKPAKEKTILKYIEFLKDVKCYDVFEHTELSELIAKHEINKSVRKALIDLSIIDYKDNAVWHYLSFEPSRQLAMTVLNFLLERAKKQRVIPIAGMEEMNATIRALTETVTNYIHKRENVLKVPQIASNGNLFSEVDSKQNMRVDIAKHIANSYFQGWELSYDYDSNIDLELSKLRISKANTTVLLITDDLVSKLLKI